MREALSKEISVIERIVMNLVKNQVLENEAARSYKKADAKGSENDRENPIINDRTMNYSGTNLPESPCSNRGEDRSSRLSLRSEFKSEKSPETRGVSEKAASDSAPLQGPLLSHAAGEKIPAKNNELKKEQARKQSPSEIAPAPERGPQPGPEAPSSGAPRRTLARNSVETHKPEPLTPDASREADLHESMAQKCKAKEPATEKKAKHEKRKPEPIALDYMRIPKKEKVFLSEEEMNTRKKLIEIDKRLSSRDRAVMMAIRKYRFLTSDQIGRLYVKDITTKTSKTRRTQLMLKRLGDFELIRPFERRVGGSGGGSSMPVWHLTNSGYRLLALNDPSGKVRKSFPEPSPTFMKHTLSIAECSVQMICLSRFSHDLAVEKIEAEPDCWRRFMDSDEQVYNLKPDLFAITTNEDNEDSFFIEIDLGTESTRQVIQKCNIYLRYYYTGVEQKEHEVFPLVVWIVKDEKRKNLLHDAIREEFKMHPNIFIVITPDELESLMREEFAAKDLC